MSQSLTGGLIRSDFRTLLELDQRLVDLMKGKRDFECPDIDHKLDGKAYKANTIEREFTRKAANIAMYNFIKYTVFGGVAGYALALTRPRTKVISVSVGSLIGSTFGVSKATIGIMRRQIDLEHSPVAVESRYQLWKINPNHYWLENYANDVKRWNRITYYGGTTDAAINHNKNVKLNEHIIQQLDKYDQEKDNNGNKVIDSDDDDFEHVQTQKRQRFYQNRKMLGHEDGYSTDAHHNDHLYDYERENRTKRQIEKNRNKTKDDKFFHFQSSQNDKQFVETNDEISWG